MLGERGRKKKRKRKGNVVKRERGGWMEAGEYEVKWGFGQLRIQGEKNVVRIKGEKKRKFCREPRREASQRRKKIQVD